MPMTAGEGARTKEQHVVHFFLLGVGSYVRQAVLVTWHQERSAEVDILCVLRWPECWHPHLHDRLLAPCVKRKTFS